jgi:hypothetical protein
MERNEEAEKRDSANAVIGSSYALFQLGKALTTAAEHADPETRARAQQRIADWVAVLNGLSSGTLDAGSRTPLAGAPNWVTLKVVTGGFASGELSAGGPLRTHERALLGRLPAVPEADARRMLNSYYISDDGLAELQELLQSGRYDVDVPEEGALLIVAWLLQSGHSEEARALIATLSPWFARLRFYPIPTARRCPFGAKVFVEKVGTTIERLRRVKPNQRVLAQREAIGVWTRLYDHLVRLFLETVEGDVPSLQSDPEGRWHFLPGGRFPVRGGWPCQRYAADWAARAKDLLTEIDRQRVEHKCCGRPERADSPFAVLREYLRRCAETPLALTGREVGIIRLILARYITRRGTPDGERCQMLRQRQLAEASAPTVRQLADVVAFRLEAYPSDEGCDDLSPLTQPISAEEAERWDVDGATPVPKSLHRKTSRCLRETVDVLVERGIITSSETVGHVLPQMTAGVQAASIDDPALRRVFATVYSAFRRRRSLLLLSLEKQVQLEELPWIAAIDRFRNDDLPAKELARQTLAEVVLLTVASFPQAILPNKLLQELRGLADTAGLDLPLVDEVAADIFMGEFSPKFLAAAKLAAALLENSLYAAYYAIDYGQIGGIPEEKPGTSMPWAKRRRGAFVQLCAARAGVEIGDWNPAKNGMIIEQQQILTTQNLAALFAPLDLADAVRDRLGDLARRCFAWICRSLQIKADRRHTRLIRVKNAAYAWRQMVFFLSLLAKSDLDEFLAWAADHLDRQTAAFADRFRPALAGLSLAADGRSLDGDVASSGGARRFLGWSTTEHWLLADLWLPRR